MSRFLLQTLLAVTLLTTCPLNSWRPVSAMAQDAIQTVTIKVLAKGNGRPVSRAEIKIQDQKVYTSKDGDASLQIPATGSGNVEIYRHSFETMVIPFADLRTASAHEIYLFPATPSDNEVLVRGARRPETSRKSVSIEEAVKVAPGGDPAQIPKMLPGVQSSRFQPTIIVRGSGPFDSNYYVDDWEVPFIFHRIGNISIIPDQILSDVEFSSGGFGAQYGGATGGIVTLRTRSDVPEHTKTEFRVNLPVYSSLYHERAVNDGKDMLAVSFRRSYLDKILPLVLPKDLDLTVVPYFGDTHVYYYKPTEDGHVKVMGLYSYDGLKLLFNSEFADDESGRGRFHLRERVSLTGIEWKKSLNSDWSLSLSPQLSDTENKIDVVGNRIHISATVLRLSTELTRRLGGRDKLYVGAEARAIRGRASILAPKPDFNDPFFDFEEAPKVEAKVEETYYGLSSWVSMDKELGSLFVTPGVRAMYETQIKRSTADPRLNARLKLDEKNALKGAVGQYSQAPQFRETSEDFGNPKLDFIRSYHYVLGLETTWSDRWTTDFQTFYKETYNLVRSDPVTNTNNDGSLISYGFESFIRRNLTAKLFGWLSYTYSVTRERDSKEETFRNSEYDQTHVANLVGNYKLTGIWELGGRFIYHTGDTYTGVDDAVYNANLDKYQPRTDEDSRKYNRRLPAYHELDIYANRDFLYDTWKLALRFGVEYLALTRQTMGVQENYDYSESEYFRGLPPIPYVEVRGIL